MRGVDILRDNMGRTKSGSVAHLGAGLKKDIALIRPEVEYDLPDYPHITGSDLMRIVIDTNLKETEKYLLGDICE